MHVLSDTKPNSSIVLHPSLRLHHRIELSGSKWSGGKSDRKSGRSEQDRSQLNPVKS
jgi:hypothetical protein